MATPGTKNKVPRNGSAWILRVFALVTPKSPANHKTRPQAQATPQKSWVHVIVATPGSKNMNPRHGSSWILMFFEWVTPNSPSNHITSPRAQATRQISWIHTLLATPGTKNMILNHGSSSIFALFAWVTQNSTSNHITSPQTQTTPQ